MNGYQQYKEQSVNTMTQGELLLLLYEELLKRLRRAEISLEKQDFSLFDSSVQRCREIVTYLMDTLDYRYEISRDLRRLYDYFIYEFIRLSSGRNPEVIGEVRPLITELRDAFAEADRKERGGPHTGDRNGLVGKV